MSASAHNFDTLAKHPTLKTVAKKLEERGFSSHIVKTGEEALAKLHILIPEKVEVMTGSSTTLHQIGFMQELENSQKQWKNLGAEVWAENDDAKRADLRRHATTAEYFLASVNAITEDGVLVAVDNTGSRVGALPFAAKNVILVVGAQKITPDLETAFTRIREYVFPKEDVRAQEAYGVNSHMNKWVIMEQDQPGRTTVILVEEALGF